MKWIKILAYLIIAVSVIVVGVLIYLPTFIENYLEDNDLQLIGREILVENIDLNYFTGWIEIYDLSMYEQDGSTIFLSLESITLDLEVLHLFKNGVYIKNLILQGLFTRIEQNETAFNFDDLSGSNDSEEESSNDSEPIHFTLENFKINRATLEYSSDIHPKAVLDSLEISIPVLSDTLDVIDIFSTMHVGSGGNISSYSKLDLAQSYYDVLFQMNELDISLVRPYFDPFIKLTSLEGVFSSDFRVHGSWEESDILDVGGTLQAQNFLMTDERNDNALSFKLLEVDIDTVIMNQAIYQIDHVSLDGFYGLYEMYDEGDNWSNMLTAINDSVSVDSLDGTGTEIDYSNPFAVLGHYLKDIAKSYAESTYKVEEVSITNSAFDFNDYIPSQPFRYQLTDVFIHADSLNSSEETLTFTAESALNGRGRFEGYLKVFTENIEDIDLYCDIKGTELSFFSPYTADYVDYSVSEGELHYTCDTKIRNGIIASQNLIHFDQFNFGPKQNGQPFYNLPVKLAVSLLKDIDGNIDLDVPIEGNLKDPEYKLGKVIWSTVKNILLKAATAPFRLIASAFGINEEDISQINFGHLQIRLNKTNKKHLDDLVKVLENKKDLNVEFKRITQKYEAIEHFAITESKFRYLYKKHMPEIDEVSDEVMEELNVLNVKDSLFIRFVDDQVLEQDQALPIQRKCILMVGEEYADSKVDRVGFKRSKAISDYLIEEKHVSEERIRYTSLPQDSLIIHRSSALYDVDFWVNE